jgi:hypothetical protein
MEKDKRIAFISLKTIGFDFKDQLLNYSIVITETVGNSTKQYRVLKLKLKSELTKKDIVLEESTISELQSRKIRKYIFEKGSALITNKNYIVQ